jgi:hypothetical protein
VWWTQAPPRAAFFVWLAALGKILTLDNLRKRHMIVVNRCCMCKRSEETDDHFLLDCEVAFALWSAFFGRFELSCVMPRRVFKLLAVGGPGEERRGGGGGGGGGGWSAAVWKMVLTCFFWCLWKERNNRCFEDLERSSEDILLSCFCILYLWTVVYVCPVSISYDEFLVRFDPYCILPVYFGAPYVFNKIDYYLSKKNVLITLTCERMKTICLV